MFNQLTQRDIDAMQKEIEERKLVIRPKLLEDVKEARAHGDLSENFEYYAAKKEKNKNESRIRFLERMIKTAEIIPDDAAEDEIGMNSIVTVQFGGDLYDCDNHAWEFPGESDQCRISDWKSTDGTQGW